MHVPRTLLLRRSEKSPGSCKIAPWQCVELQALPTFGDDDVSMLEWGQHMSLVVLALAGGTAGNNKWV